VSPVRTLCVFCGSRPGISTSITAAAGNLGTALAERDIGLVYGGASVGVMGVLADAALAEGGRVTGVITSSLVDHEIAHPGLSELHVVETMHERKALMASLSDAFVMMPGGFGTYEEFFEAVTWVQLGIHHKPCGILDVDDFFGHLFEFISNAEQLGFIRSDLAKGLVVSDDLDTLLDAVLERGQR
jgi:uncharacterized protein (TIGR00730 family)